MIAIAHFLAVSLYLGAAALAAAPFARPIAAPVRGVLVVLGIGVGVHAAALAALGWSLGQVPITGLGPALSFAGFVLAATLLVAELLAREASLTLLTAPLAALPTVLANVLGLEVAAGARGLQGAWLYSHIALSFVGIAAFATAAMAGTMYLVERRELRSRRFGALFRFFPPLETLDRVNHVAAIVGWVALTVGVVLAVTYSLAHREPDALKLVWAIGAWLGAGAVALGRIVAGWRARRAALVAAVAFGLVLLLYVAFRVVDPSSGRFL